MTELIGQGLTLGQRLSGADFSLVPGELVAIVGPNGSGKSSLLRMLAGQRRPDAGQIWLSGSAMETLAPLDRARRLAYLPQRAEVAWPISVADMVALGGFAFGQPRAINDADTARVTACLESVGCAHLLARSTATLSGGELALAALARLFVSAAPLMLLDEPTAALDPAHQHRVMGVLRDKTASGSGVAAVLHDLNLAAAYADRIIWMREGRIIANSGTTAGELRTLIPETFGVEPFIFENDAGRIDGVAIARKTLRPPYSYH